MTKTLLLYDKRQDGERKEGGQRKNGMGWVGGWGLSFSQNEFYRKLSLSDKIKESYALNMVSEDEP